MPQVAAGGNYCAVWKPSGNCSCDACSMSWCPALKPSAGPAPRACRPAAGSCQRPAAGERRCDDWADGGQASNASDNTNDVSVCGEHSMQLPLAAAPQYPRDGPAACPPVPPAPWCRLPTSACTPSHPPVQAVQQDGRQLPGAGKPGIISTLAALCCTLTCRHACSQRAPLLSTALPLQQEFVVDEELHKL